MKNIKMIAVDMDGTFLRSDMSYNKERFMAQYDEMKKRDIRFVVASGNQYYQLISFFPEIRHEISFVAENGAFVVHEDEKLFNGVMSPDLVHDVMDVLGGFDTLQYILCGVESAYIRSDVSDEFFADVNRYYHRLERSENLYTVRDTIFKIALIVEPEYVQEVNNQLNEKVGHLITAVTSGHRAIDLIIPGVHKANGLKKLQDLLGIEDHEIVSFGDSGNDVEMLKHSGHSFAMANGTDEVKACANEVCLSNDHEGVLEIIDRILV